MRKDQKYTRLVAAVLFMTIMGFLFTALLYSMVSEWKNYHAEMNGSRHAYADWLDCDNWGYECEELA